MKTLLIHSLVIGALLFAGSQSAFAWGRGGGGGMRVGGFNAGGFSAGAARVGCVGAVGGARVGGFGEVGGARFGEVGAARVGGFGEVGGARVATSGARVGDVGAARVNTFSHVGEVGVGRVSTVGHVGVATDFGFGHVAGAAGVRGYVGAGHFTTAYSGAALAARGAAVRRDFYHYNAFGPAWWGAHPGAWRPYGWPVTRPWGWATWPYLTGWFGWGGAPVYFDYGTNIVYQGDQVYIDNQSGPTAAVYYQQAADLAQSAPPPAAAPKKDDEWTPLGVFALVQGEQSDTSAVFQLAVNKAGVIGGNYYNVLTSTTLPVRGAVDPKTQRASWIVGDQKTTVYDTGIYNLTKDQSPVLIHFAQDRTQQWLLIRVKESDATAPSQQAADVAPAPPQGTAKGTASVTVIVPADAEVTIDGAQTSLTGTERAFVTPPLAAGYNFSYTIRARWTTNGNPVEQTRKVTFSAGANVRVDFTAN
jgi:uncharacterized protein (TIGR03000 family)